jgi:hypothetical protein
VPDRSGVPGTSPLRYANGAKLNRGKLTTSIKFRARSWGNKCKRRRYPRDAKLQVVHRRVGVARFCNQLPRCTPEMKRVNG